MASIAASLTRALPKPKYTGEEEDIPLHAQQKGPRIVGPGVLDDTQLVLKVSKQPSHTTCEEKQLMRDTRNPGLQRMANDRDGDLEDRRTLEMVELSLRFQLRSTHWIWAARDNHLAKLSRF